MPIETKTDEQLMLEYASGELAAFEELFSRYGKKLYNLFLRSLNKAEMAQDLLQETFIRVIEARHRYQPKRAFSNWIFTIAMNLLRDKYREKARRPIHQATNGFNAEIVSVEAKEDEPQQALERFQLKQAVMKALDTLPVDQRDVIILSKYEGLSFLEIGKILNISPAAAKQKAYRGMQNLRKKLAHLKKE